MRSRIASLYSRLNTSYVRSMLRHSVTSSKTARKIVTAASVATVSAVAYKHFATAAISENQDHSQQTRQIMAMPSTKETIQKSRNNNNGFPCSIEDIAKTLGIDSSLIRGVGYKQDKKSYYIKFVPSFRDINLLSQIYSDLYKKGVKTSYWDEADVLSVDRDGSSLSNGNLFLYFEDGSYGNSFLHFDEDGGPSYFKHKNTKKFVDFLKEMKVPISSPITTSYMEKSKCEIQNINNMPSFTIEEVAKTFCISRNDIGKIQFSGCGDTLNIVFCNKFKTEFQLRISSALHTRNVEHKFSNSPFSKASLLIIHPDGIQDFAELVRSGKNINDGNLNRNSIFSAVFAMFTKPTAANSANDSSLKACKSVSRTLG